MLAEPDHALVARNPLEQWNNNSHVESVGDGRFVMWDEGKVRLVSADLVVAGRFDEGGEVVLVKTNRRGDRLAIARRTGPLTMWEVSTKSPWGELHPGPPVRAVLTLTTISIEN